MITHNKKDDKSSKWIKAQLRLAAHYLKLANSVDLDRGYLDGLWSVKYINSAWPVKIL